MCPIPGAANSRLTENSVTTIIKTTAWQGQWTRMNAYEDNTEQDWVTRGQTGWQRRPNTQQSHNQDRTTWEPANDKDTALDRALDKSYTTQEWHRLETLDNTGQHKDIIGFSPKPTPATSWYFTNCSVSSSHQYGIDKLKCFPRLTNVSVPDIGVHFRINQRASLCISVVTRCDCVICTLWKRSVGSLMAWPR